MSSLPSDPAVLPAPRPRRRRWRHVLLATIIFLGGAACGAAFATHVVMHALHRRLHHSEELAAHLAGRLRSVLDLTDAQTRQVRELIERRHEALSEIRQEVQPRVEAELAILEAEIDAVLTDEQRPRWREHVAKFRARWLPPLPPPPPRP